MEFSKKQPAFLYLEKNGFYFYQEGLPSILSLGFAENAVKDMDVINGASVIEQIKSFVEQNHLLPATITVILSPNVTFEKDIVGLDPESQEETTKNFIDTIPFESVRTKNYPVEKGIKVIGCNDELLMQLKIGFEKISFALENVIPYQLLGSDQVLIKNMTTDNVSQFLRHIDRLKQFSLMYYEKEKTPTPQIQTPKTETPVKKKNTRLFLMIGVFAVLFLVLGFMLLNMK